MNQTGNPTINFVNNSRNIVQKKMKWVTATYDLLEKNDLPLIDSDTIVIYLFFPFTYWDKHIEKEGYNGVYGNVGFYNKFRVFWSERSIELSKRSIEVRKHVL